MGAKKRLVIFDKEAGAIEQFIIDGQFDKLKVVYEGIGKGTALVDETHTFETSCVVGGKIKKRATLNPKVGDGAVKAGGGEIRIGALPKPCFVVIKFVGHVVASETVTDGSVAFSALQAGDYEITITSAAHLPCVLIVKVEP